MTNDTFTIGKRTFTILFPDLLRPLSDRERRDLRSSMALHGVQSPVLVDEENGVIDGGHRVMMSVSLGLGTIPIKRVRGLSLDEKARLAMSLNCDRRHLDLKEKKRVHKEYSERVARVVKARQHGASTRAIAAAEGISHVQVQNDLAVATGNHLLVDPPATVVGLDGKERPATRPAPKVPPDLVALRKAWKKATPASRDTFLVEIQA